VTYYSVPLQKGETDSLRPQVLALMLAAGFILLIACANLAGLTLVRMLRRAPEVATRLALGASRWQIQKQFWIENLLLALVGGVVALTVVLLAASGLLIRTLVHLETLPPGFNPNGVIVAKASLDDVRFHDPAAFRKLLDEGTAAMRNIPGVQNAAVGLSLPYE